MADYKYVGPTVEDGVFKYEGNLSIPNAQGNRHWKEYERYVAEGGLTDPWKTQAELDEMAAEEARLAAIEERLALLEAEQEVDKIHDYTPAQIRNYIDNQIDGAATSGDKLEVIKTILKKMAIYILK